MEVSKTYWSKRYNKEFSYRTSAHLSFSWSYNKYVYKAYERSLSKLLKKQNISIESCNILDIGSGTGYYIDYYNRHKVKSLIGTDITNISVNQLSENFPQYSFIQHDISKPLPFFKNSNFDIISVFDVLYYIIDDKLFRKALENLSNVCNKNSLLIITDRFENVIPSTGKIYFKHRSLNFYKSELKKLNLKIIDYTPVNYLLKKPILFPGLYSFLKWELSKMKIDLERFIGRTLFSLDPIFMNPKRSDIQMIIVKRIN